MENLVWLVLAFPLLGVLLNGLLSHLLPAGLRRPFVVAVGVGVVALAFAAALGLFINREALLGGEAYRDFILYHWLGSTATADERIWEPFHIPVGARLDALSLVMMLVVTGVGLLIHLYSVGYMAEEARFARYFTYLNLFTFSMLLLVLANNYAIMFVGWEGVGLCSYLLIGFWFERSAPAQAGKKAFLVNRVGDWGFLVGLIALAWVAGTLTYSELFTEATLERIRVAGPILGLSAAGFITLCLFIGATGKSAQLPLYMWLPDAMEGPTPVSALIHAATMVTAGVYMVARSAALFGMAPETQLIVVGIGIATALFAALIAVVQYDIKRILAYSTVSQLGFMFVAVGVGAYAAGVAHLVTHAFFKALLFLAAGSVIHALHGEQDIRKMGGLARALPVTFLCAGIGWLAIAGFPGLSGFYSKDAILYGAFQAPGMQLVGWLALFVAALTAFYMTRFFLGTFFGESRLDPDVHVHREAPVMNVPLLALAVLSLGGGWLVVGWWPGAQFHLREFLEPVLALGTTPAAAAPPAAGGLGHDAVAILSIAAMALGVGGGLLLHRAGLDARSWPEKNFLVRLVDNKFYYDAILHRVFVVWGTALCTAVWHLIDVLVIDGLVNGTAKLVAFFADVFRSLQIGYVRNYALIILAGAAFVLACFLWVPELQRFLRPPAP